MTWPATLSLCIGLVGWGLAVHAVVNALLLRRPAPSSPEPISEPVSILLPMRNEALRLRRSLPCMLAQRGFEDVEVLVLDDESTDGSAELARSFGGSAARILTGSTPPPGWLGKTWACEQLAEAAGGSVLVFVDADVTLSADAVARAVRLLRSARLDFMSPYPRQLAGSALGLLTQPLLAWSWLTFLPLRLAESSTRRSLAAANGQFLVVDANAYHRVGGHAAVAADVLEDVALARAFKAAGCRGGIVDGSRLASCRMYDDNRSLVPGYAKWLWSAFGSSAGALLVAAVMLVLFVLPWALIAVTPWGWFAAAAGPASRLVAAARTRGNVMLALLHPLSMLCFAVLLSTSLGWHRTGRVSWKGRKIP